MITTREQLLMYRRLFLVWLVAVVLFVAGMLLFAPRHAEAQMYGFGGRYYPYWTIPSGPYGWGVSRNWNYGGDPYYGPRYGYGFHRMQPGEGGWMRGYGYGFGRCPPGYRCGWGY